MFPSNFPNQNSSNEDSDIPEETLDSPVYEDSEHEWVLDSSLAN